MIGRIKGKLARRRNERGSVVALAAVGMVSLVLASGMAVDISHFYTAATELQNAADAAALAGASALNHTGAGIDEAVDRAVAAMNKYDFNGANVTINRSNVRFAKNLSSFDGSGTGISENSAKADPQDIRFVKVSVPTTAIKTYFASMVLGSAVNMNRSAVAGQSSTSVGVNTVCNVAPFVLFEGGDRDLKIVKHNDENCDCYCDNTLFHRGHTYEVKELETGCSGNVEGGSYAIIDQKTNRVIDQGSWRQRLSLGLEGCVTTCQNLQAATGVSEDSIQAGMNTRFDSYNGVDPSMAPPDTNIKEGITYDDYKDGGSGSRSPTHPGLSNRRIIIIPIANIKGYNKSNKKVSFSKYGVFFLTKPVDSNATMTLEYIRDSFAVGDGSYNPDITCANTTQVTVPVLYR